MPPTTTLARGCCDWASIPLAMAAGNSPMAAANDVINTGRIRTSALFMMASRISYPSRNRSCIRLMRISAPSTATPKSEINPPPPRY